MSEGIAAQLWDHTEPAVDRILSSPFAVAFAVGYLPEAASVDFKSLEVDVVRELRRIGGVLLARCDDEDAALVLEFLSALANELISMGTPSIRPGEGKMTETPAVLRYLQALRRNAATPLEMLVAAIYTSIRLLQRFAEQLGSPGGMQMSEAHPQRLWMSQHASASWASLAGLAAKLLDRAAGIAAKAAEANVGGVQTCCSNLLQLFYEALPEVQSSAPSSPESRSSFFINFDAATLETFQTSASTWHAQLLGSVSSQVSRPPRRAPRVLIVAGSDSGGGAGIQADIKACEANGAFSMTAVTALTAQNTQGVQGVFPATAEFLAQQMESCLEDIGADVIKTGMLPNEEQMKAVAAAVRKYKVPLVLDPVMVASSGDLLIDLAAVECLKKDLFGEALLITPNLHEAMVLLHGVEHSKAMIQDGLSKVCATAEDLQRIAKDMGKLGPRYVLAKGGHAAGTISTDAVYNTATDECHLFYGPRVETRNTHGTGCTLASASAAGIARGMPVPAAVEAAKAYLTASLERSSDLCLGTGAHGPMQHSPHSWWP